MREAKEGTKEIAEQAAYGAAMGVARQLSPELQSLKSAVSGQSGDPFARMVSMMQEALSLTILKAAKKSVTSAGDEKSRCWLL